MVERTLSMREAQGSIPCSSTFFRKKKRSAQPESNQRPRDINCKQLQSPALPTELYADGAGKYFQNVLSREERTPHTPRTPNSFGFDHINRNAPVLIRTPKLTRFEPAQYWGGGPPGNSVVLNPFFCYFFCFFWFLFFDQTKKAPRPGIEPGLQGSKPWVLTNYTREP
jgi:hypothetical protein